MGHEGARHLQSATSTARDPWPARIAFVIAVVSVLSAVVAWRASIASIDETGAQVRAIQATARQVQIEQAIESIVDHDERLAADYQEHLVAAVRLEQTAEELRPTDAALADELDLEAQGRRALARQTARFFRAAIPDVADDGSVTYDPAFVARNLRETDQELRELRPDRFLAQADRAGDRSDGLVAMALLLVAGLFFLTLAQLVRTGARPVFLAVGVLAAVVATVGFVALEVVLATG